MNISPRSHIYRLIVLLVIVVVGFVAVRGLAIPSSWDSENFYRLDSLDELKLQPMQIGGNESCGGASCHDQERVAKHKTQLATVGKGSHKGLACENCHGPLSAHVSDDKKIASAVIDRENKLCLNCHGKLLSRPKNFPQFDTEKTGHWYFDVEITKPCLDCHSPHNPRQMAVKKDKSKKQPKATSEQTSTNGEVQL
jgi:predicted CXXCH cytochrome family protein